MKIGIITFWNSNNNYGQILQIYALQKYLRKRGHEPYLIRYFFGDDYIADPKNIRTCVKKYMNPSNYTRRLKNICKERIAHQEEKNDTRKFDAFKEKYIAQSDRDYHSHEELEKDPPIADVYIAGSDQIWNFWGKPVLNIRHRLHTFFLDFGDSHIERVSYAASWGRNELTEEEISEIAPLLRRFSHISVREKSGVELCRKCGVENAKWACDPTLLLSCEDYRELYVDEVDSQWIGKMKLGKYLLIYYVDNGKHDDLRGIFQWAKSRNLDVKYVAGNNTVDRYQKIYPSIPEWIWLIDKAEYVVTNSFHGCVFSLIFQKKFAAIPITGAFESMNERLNSLFELCHVSPRYLDGAFQILEMEPEPIHMDMENMACGLDFMDNYG